MSRPRLIFLAFLVSCATSSTNMPLPDGGGGAGGTGTLVGNGGGGGSPPIDAAPLVDAGACAPFAETYTQACLACLAESCCDVAVMCFQVPDCFGYASCRANCPLDAGIPVGGGSDGGTTDAGGDDGGSADAGGDDGGSNVGGGNVCLDACAMGYPMAQPAFGAMATCLHAKCAGSCPF